MHPAEGKRRIRLRHGGRPETCSREYDDGTVLAVMDGTPERRTGETRTPLPPRPGQPAAYGSGHGRNGTADLFMVHPPAGGVAPREGHRPPQEAGLRKAARRHRRRPLSGQENRPRDGQPDTHRLSTLHQAFGPAEASRPADRFEVHHTPRHGSWLNMAETGTDVLSRQCPARRIPDREAMVREAGAWQRHRNPSAKPVDWRFRTGDARVKLKSLYPSQQ